MVPAWSSWRILSAKGMEIPALAANAVAVTTVPATAGSVFSSSSWWWKRVFISRE
jgi:hypothetical protein